MASLPRPLIAPSLTTLAMLAFASNSLLCRAALGHAAIDAGPFTAVRLLSGALVLGWLARGRAPHTARAGNWPSATALFVYAAAFSWAYRSLTAATGALLLFGAVQLTMIGWGLAHGERLRVPQWGGFLAAALGLLALLLPGLQAPPWHAALLMLGAGAAWGVYSLRGRGTADPLTTTAGNFWRAAVLGLALLLLAPGTAWPTHEGLALAAASGALASGVGYAVWYRVLPSLAATTAASVQLVVPVLTALCAVLLLDEPVSTRLLVCAAVVLGGIGALIRWRGR